MRNKSNAIKFERIVTTRLIWLASYLFLGCLVIACSDDNPEPLIEPTPEIVYAGVPNGNFEEGVKGWNISGDNSVVSITEGGCDGPKALMIAGDVPYTVTVQQTITGMKDGYYDLEYYLKSTGGQTACYVAAGGDDIGKQKMTSLPQSENKWLRSIVRGIKVENGKCNVRIYVNSERATNCQIDALKLVEGTEEFNFLKGGDFSRVSFVEKSGGKYYENGVEKDIYQIVKDNGWNTIRLRLYNDPGNPNFEPSSQIPEGCQNLEDTKAQCKRAKEQDLKVCLTLHYSDTWTNPGQQIMPHEWEGLSWEELKTAFFDYTQDVMIQLRDQGTPPEYVAIGNEVQSGICHPLASWEHYDRLSELFNLGYDAVKSVSPESQVVIHLSNGGDGFDYFFGQMTNFQTKYDLIGVSYYPFDVPTGNYGWDHISEWAEWLYNLFGKEIIMMETGYNWNPTIPMGIEGQLSTNPYYKNIYPYTPLGQKNYMLEAFNEMKLSKGGHIKGVYYWDPVSIFVPGVQGLDGGNGICNATFFDFEGNTLEIFDAFKYNN